jgi:nitrite reductase (NADH) small subunit
MAEWIKIGCINDLQADSGICALVGKTQVAVFYMPKENKVYAINNYDPFSQASVLSRGLIGDINGIPMVSSPIYKQHFNLETGQCFEDDAISVESYQIRIENGCVEVSLTE